MWVCLCPESITHSHTLPYRSPESKAPHPGLKLENPLPGGSCQRKGLCNSRFEKVTRDSETRFFPTPECCSQGSTARFSRCRRVMK